MECRYNVCRGESLKAKSLVVSRGAVNEDESISISTNRDTVVKHDVHVDSIQAMVFSAIEQAAAFGFWNGGIRTKGGGKLATVHPFSVTTDLKEMFIISEFPTAHDSMELLCRPMGLCVRGIGGITQLNQGEGCARLVTKVGNLLGGHSGEKARRW
jgi:hypothetical protein